MVELRDELNHAVVLMVWGRDGPVIVRAEDSHHPVSVRFRVGQPLPVLSSASGVVLAAHLPWPAVRPIIEKELACAAIHGNGEPPSIEQVQERLAEAKRRGLSRIVGTLTPGMAACAAPVFNAAGARGACAWRSHKHTERLDQTAFLGGGLRKPDVPPEKRRFSYWSRGRYLG